MRFLLRVPMSFCPGVGLCGMRARWRYSRARFIWVSGCLAFRFSRKQRLAVLVRQAVLSVAAEFAIIPVREDARTVVREFARTVAAAVARESVISLVLVVAVSHAWMIKSPKTVLEQHIEVVFDF